MTQRDIYEELKQKNENWKHPNIPVIHIDYESSIIWTLDPTFRKLVGYWSPDADFSKMTDRMIFRYADEKIKSENVSLREVS